MRRNGMAINQTLLATPAAMAGIDKAAIDSGIDGFALMLAAGAHVAAVFLAHYPQALRAVVLCGPGNNGGDGHVAARLLMESGVEVVRHGAAPRPAVEST